MVVKNCKIGVGTVLSEMVDLYGCRIGNSCKVGSFTRIEGHVWIGDNVIIKGNCYIPTGVQIRDNVFVGHGTMFTNDKHPKIGGSWECKSTIIQSGVSIGANCTILCDLTIGKDVLVGAGSVVTKDVPDGVVAMGNPAKWSEELLREYGL